MYVFIAGPIALFDHVALCAQGGMRSNLAQFGLDMLYFRKQRSLSIATLLKLDNHHILKAYTRTLTYTFYRLLLVHPQYTQTHAHTLHLSDKLLGPYWLRSIHSELYLLFGGCACPDSKSEIACASRIADYLTNRWLVERLILVRGLRSGFLVLNVEDCVIEV